MPWRNGKGQTVELARAGPPENFAWRVSRAMVVEDGPFSEFLHIDRILVLLSGAGLILRFADGRTARLDRVFDEVRFAGDVRVDCTLIDGVCEDLNFMVDRRVCSARLERHEADAVVAGAGTKLFYALAGEWLVAGLALPVGCLAVVTDEAAVALRGAGLVLGAKIQNR
jgi:environmental stress-induced protein Ves